MGRCLLIRIPPLLGGLFHCVLSVITLMFNKLTAVFAAGSFAICLAITSSLLSSHKADANVLHRCYGYGSDVTKAIESPRSGTFTVYCNHF